MEKLLITGSEGFIGSHLKKYFHNKFEILGLDTKISIFHDIRYINYISKYICDFQPDYIIHLAANPDVSISTIYPQEDLLLNVNGTLNILELAKKVNVKLIIFTSSACVYGETTKEKIDEESPILPSSQYGVGKFAAEEYCRLYFRKYKLPVVIFRQFNIYGPNQSTNFVIPNLIKRIKECKESRLMLYGAPTDARDFTNVKDLCRAFECSLKCKPAGETFNIGSGNEYKIFDIAQIIKKFLKKDIELYYSDHILPGKISRLCADISKAKKILKWKPQISIEEGLFNLINYK
ncbi:MAG TPA: GDP-mannose 4,6-dehydratase [bacterium]|nr:GDP-mannose 4,6-dehydratase [bacterium]HOL46914.1 GDP-mannose 4,6-dehydratase [bacterium]HPQ18324.1 GDP-mannose 4,6-dehydratase [bacterium]